MRRSATPRVTLATIQANTGTMGVSFPKGTVIHPLNAVDASGTICPNNCGHSSLKDQAGIVIKQKGWYYIYASVEFSTITQPTLLGWKIDVCNRPKHSGKSQCTDDGIRTDFQARKQAIPGEPGTLFGGKVVYCYENEVISIVPLFDNLKINMFPDTTYLGVYML